MREERYGKVTCHDAVELAINCGGAHYPIQLGLHVSNRGEVDSDCRGCVRRPRQSPDLVEMSRLEEVGAVSRIGHLDELTAVLGELPEHLRERLGLDRVLKEFRLLDRQADDAHG